MKEKSKVKRVTCDECDSNGKNKKATLTCDSCGFNICQKCAEKYYPDGCEYCRPNWNKIKTKKK